MASDQPPVVFKTIKTVYYPKDFDNVSSESQTTGNGINKRQITDVEESKEEPKKKSKPKTIEELDSEEKWVLKSVITYLLKNKDATIEEFLENTDKFYSSSTMPRLNLVLIEKYAKFICEEVSFMVKFSNQKYQHIPSTPFMMELHKNMLKNEEIDRKCEEEAELKAVSTTLIDQICDELSFANALNDEIKMDKIFSDKNRMIRSSFMKKSTDKRLYHGYIKIGKIEVSSRVYVCVKEDKKLRVGQIAYCYTNREEFQKMVHLIWLLPGRETILCEAADPKEFFLSDKCDCVKLSDLKGTVAINQNNPDSYFMTKKYESDTGRFVDISEEDRMCPFEDHKTKLETPTIENIDSENGLKVKWNGEVYSAGDCVFLLPNVLKLKKKPAVKGRKAKVNATLYPEACRKQREDELVRRPFCVGLIKNIKTAKPIPKKTSYPLRHQDNGHQIIVEFFNFYRPENLNGKEFLKYDLNKLYASHDVVKTKFTNVVRKCNVIYAKDLTKKEIQEWTNGGPDRFYFKSAYLISTSEFVEPLEYFRRLKKDSSERLPPLNEKLACLDIFAGCGGLSEGLRQSGIADIKWAIEKDYSASRSFGMNNKSTIVFNGGCNTILKSIINGELVDENGQNFPKKGEVELLCGGPPCQGFSKMNRFSKEFNSKVSNSLVVTFLSYCDFYRPKFAIMENVKNFVSFQNGIALKFMFRCLLQMGYQVAFRILQAGSYGVPQSRNRLFIIAAAPGEILPDFPAVTHAFASTSRKFFTVGNKEFPLSLSRDILAPYRALTVRDAISDLPKIPNGFNKFINYGTSPLSHFQREMRNEEMNEETTYIFDHVCKKVSSLMEARISLIPPGGDWRDLPNKRVKLRDGKFTKKLVYTYREKGKPEYFPPRGVCRCVTGKRCHVDDKQSFTLIPWSIVHTANRNNDWQGAYGRVKWDGFFSTTITNPEPSGKQGRVLHPEQNRILSVRECARSQGFPDHFQFYGDIADKYRQIGNAVPPPLAAAIGLEIKKSLVAKDNMVHSIPNGEEEIL